MRIGFRVDASVQIGTGHVMRCLTLANELHMRGAECLFLCRPHAGHFIDLIEQSGHKVVALPKRAVEYVPPADALAHAAWLGTDWDDDAASTCRALGQMCLDWMVVDHYALDRRWEQALHPRCRRMMVIDDLADRPHDCDVLLDQNLGRSADDYSGLVPEFATLFIGPRFALLRPEFARLRSESLARRERPVLREMIITMGGVDKDNATGQVLQALEGCELPKCLQITVVMGAKAPWLEEVRAQAALMRWPVQVLVGVTDMARLMVNSDLAIGAAGSTAWERCCLGLPTLLLLLADNQRSGVTALQNAKAALVIERVDDTKLILNKLLATDGGCECLCGLSAASASLTDGGGVSRICDQLMVGYG